MNTYQANADKIRHWDELAAEIYLDKKYYYLTNSEISELRNLPVPMVKCHYKNALYILKHLDQMWCHNGLSRQSRLAILRAGYRSFMQVYNDVFNRGKDLTDYPDIGESKSREIKEWLIKNKK